MINNVFLSLSKEERTKKLDTVLRNRTNNALTSDELDALVSSVHTREQYAIRVYTDPVAFKNAVTPESQSVRVSLIFGQIPACRFYGRRKLNLDVLYDSNAAAIVSEETQNGQNHNAIIIYIPRHLLFQGMGIENGQGEKTAYCL